MIHVHLQTPTYSELIATFENEEIYLYCLESLEKYAHNNGAMLTETVTNKT